MKRGQLRFRFPGNLNFHGLFMYRHSSGFFGGVCATACASSSGLASIFRGKSYGLRRKLCNRLWRNFLNRLIFSCLLPSVWIRPNRNTSNNAPARATLTN